MIKLRETPLVEYVNEYIQYGMQCGFFFGRECNQIRERLLNLDVEFVEDINGDAMCNGNTLIVNRKIFQKKDNAKYASLVLFHEFTHICSDVHKHTQNNGLFVQLRNYVENNPGKIDTTYYKGSCTTEMGDTNNPYTYILFGALLLDEVTAEHVATEMVKKKYMKYVLPKEGQRVYGNGTYIHRYKSHFDYYGVGENLIDQFSKTLFLKNGFKNLNGLCSEIFKEGFTYDLIRQHNENPIAFQHLIDELGYLGVIGFSEEQFNGRYAVREKISSDLISYSFKELERIFQYGIENREEIPGSISAPEFME